MASNSLKAAKESYERDGYVIFSDVLDKDLIQEADEHIRWLMNKHPNVRPENLHSNFMPKDPFWLRLVSDDRLLDIAEQFIGHSIALYRSQYLSKPPLRRKARALASGWELLGAGANGGYHTLACRG